MSVLLPEGYQPSEEEEYMNPLQREYFRQKLLRWKEELITQSGQTIERLQTEEWHQADLNDCATTETERIRDVRTRERYRKLIDKIDQALLRMDTEEYGYCQETGDPIGIKRLEARPIATLSIESQELHEMYERQHVDDDVDG